MRIAKFVLPVIASCLALPASAGATTFCVGQPTGCDGVDLAGGQLESGAMQSPLLANGVPDEIVIGPGSYSDADAFSLIAGTDPLDIRGAGPDATVLTSTSATAPVLLDLDQPTRPVTVRGLAVDVPPTWLDGGTSTYGIRSRGHLEDVRVTSRNPGTIGIQSGGTSTLRRVEVSALDGRAVMAGYGAYLTVEDSRLAGSTAIDTGGYQVMTTLNVKRSILTATSGAQFGMALYSTHASTTIRDSLIRVRSNGIVNSTGIMASSGWVVADHVTIVRDAGPVDKTIGVWAYVSGGSNPQINLTNSVVSRVAEVGRRTGAGAGYTGTAKVVLAHNLLPTAFPAGTGAGSVVIGPGNLIAADPGFVDAAGGDFRLLAGSPAIDSGDPAFADSTAALDGVSRVLDGNGDGIAVTDRGAYEAPVPPRGKASEPGGTSGGGGTADLIAPVVSGFSATNKRLVVGGRPTTISAASKRTTFRFSLSEPATATIAIQRLLPGRKVGGECRKPTRRLRRRMPCKRVQTKGTLTPRPLPAGPAAIRFTGRIGTKRLRPGSYRAVVVARDAAGNASRPARAAFKVVRR